MKKQITYIAAILFMATFFTGCGSKSSTEVETTEKGQVQVEEELSVEGEVHLSELKKNSIGIKVDVIPTRPLSGVVEANGQLEVPPQHEATVTAILGANVTAIKVIEGDKVKKGQTLATLAHPNLSRLQSDYVRAYHQLQFLQKEYERQKKLYDENVGSGKIFQQTQADYLSMKGEVKGFEAQLGQLSLNIAKVQNGDVYQNVPVVSPIDGYIEKVEVQIGQYVDPQKDMFMIVNNEHIHADLMVFEKDVHKVKKGQDISFTVESVPGVTLKAKIYSVGKQFEQNPKAVHVHAEIEKKNDFLIPGMYINGRIHTGEKAVLALPESAVIEEEGKSYIFTVTPPNEDNNEMEWGFKAVEIRTGLVDDGWVEIKLLEPLPEKTKVAWDNAYYLIAEMKKGSTEHGH
ncbi:efflux RND transporter periplasmic adaptor subunit [uncultured Roseivirga sp.]|uniref:efflux RND transporter periplasmic adaptor subunit n=1 Tax=uncultured Roseivirga sp. TaxID=543088 RepID=UPI0030DB00CE|tara:strand:- start:16022 stop:17230 length:1209 start_codon:yes stop_codon:yes gene_type:complete